MVVKIKCAKCRTSKVIKVENLKQARNVKRSSKRKNYTCNKCYFSFLVYRTARQFIKENNYGYGKGTQQRGF
jgi:hypothetical protein